MRVVVMPLVLALAAALDVSAHVSALPQVGSSRVALAIVTDLRNRSLVDISADDFVIQEAGAAREVLSVRPADYPIVILFDTGAGARGTGPEGEVLIQHAPVSFTREARITTEGGYRFFAGLRSEPFFADPDGFQNNMQWTGRDGWAGKNIFGIVLEVPNSALGSHPQIGVWGRTMALVHSTLTPVNQMGRPGNNVFRQGADTNTTPPAQQREQFSAQYIAMFKTFGYTEAEATTLTLEWLPDILPYNYTSAAGYPNGRQLTDDIVDNVVDIMTRGKMRDDLVGPHTDYLAEFPYLGPPHEG